MRSRRLLRFGAGTLRQALANDIGLYAAGVAFFGLLSLFPALAAFVAGYGVFGDPAVVRAHVDLIRAFTPRSVTELADEQLTRLVAADAGALALAGLVSLLLSVWSASRGADAFVQALNRVEGAPDRRGFAAQTLASLAFTLGGAATAIAVIAALAIAPALIALSPLDRFDAALLDAARWAVALAAVSSYAAALYRWGPTRAPTPWRAVGVSACLAAFVWIAGSAGLSLYVERFAGVSESYGSIAAGVVLILWLYLSAYVFLLGGVLSRRLATDASH